MTEEQPASVENTNQEAEQPHESEESVPADKEEKISPDSPKIPSPPASEKPRTEETDQFGRIVRPSEESDQPKVSFPPKRPLFDAEIELNYVKSLSPENVAIANKIAKVIVMIGNPSSRLNDAEINDMATKLFTEFSKYTEILLQMFFASMVRMSPQIESLAALIGVYCERFYKTYESKLIQKVIPEALQDAFQKDHFRVVKLLLRFLGAFVAYKLVTPASFVALLQSLADMIESATPCRGENLARAIIVACKTAPSCVSDDDLDPVYQKVHSFIETRPNQFIEHFSPFARNSSSFLDVITNSERLPHFTESYVQLFNRVDETKAESIPQISFSFGEVDRAPFPFVVLQIVEEVTAGFDPVIADIADDILVFFGDDANLTADQMLALPMLLNYSSLKLTEANQNQNSHFIIPLFNTIILSDLLRIPTSYYPPAFHVCVFTNLIDMKKDSQIIQQNLSPVILNIVSDINSLDPGCYFRLVRFFAHYISLYRFSWCWERWALFTQYAEEDMRLMFLTDVFSHCYFLGNVESITRALKDSFNSIMPLKPELKISADNQERSDKLKDVLANETDKFDDSYSELVGITGEFQALKIFIDIVFSLGEGDAEKTIRKVDEYGKLIQQYFAEGWKKKLLVTSAFECFTLMPPVLEELMIYFIANNFCDVEIFLSHFFDKTNDVIKSPESWELFNVVMDSVIAMYTSSGLNKSAQDAVKNVFTSASEFFAKKDFPLSEVAERFAFGNLKEFGRHHYDIFASIDTEMNGLIAAEGVENKFSKVITTISSLGSQ